MESTSCPALVGVSMLGDQGAWRGVGCGPSCFTASSRKETGIL